MDIKEYVEHSGILGMKWGTKRGQKKADNLVREVDQTMKRFDAGRRGIDVHTFREQSRKARKLTYKANKRIARMNKYLNEVKNEPVNNVLVKWNKNPEKVKQVKDYLARNQMQTKKLSELRTSLIDIKLDVM